MSQLERRAIEQLADAIGEIGKLKESLKQAHKDLQHVTGLYLEANQACIEAEDNLKTQTEEAIILRHKWAIAQEFISKEDFIEYEKDLKRYDNLEHHLIGS